jgi:hypothetical protein
VVYKKLNDVTKKKCFSLPQTDEILDMLAKAKWSSTQTEEQLLAGGSASRQGEDCILDMSRVMAEDSHALWTLQSSINI